MSETSQKHAWQNLPPTSKWRLFELTCLRCNGMPWQHIPSKIRWRIIIRISTWCADWNEKMTVRDPKHINYSFGILNQKETQTELYVKGTSRMDPLGAKLKRLDLSKKATAKNGFTSRALRRIQVNRKPSDLLTVFMQKRIPIKQGRLGKQGHDYLTTSQIMWPDYEPNHVAKWSKVPGESWRHSSQREILTPFGRHLLHVFLNQTIRSASKI